MHELAVTKQILTHVLDYAEKNEAERVTLIHMQLGRLRGIEYEWLKRYFTFASKGTVAEGAVISVDWIPGGVICQCGIVTPIILGQALDEIRCMRCNGTKLQLHSGMEFILAEICVASKKGGESIG